MGKIIDLTGMTFNRLKVLRKSDNISKDGKPLWDCLCTCGKLTTSKTIDLRSNKKKSCGCLRLETNSNYKHGQGSPKNKTREYRIWQGIIQRVRNKNAPAYPLYGGRGISISNEWLSFSNFFNDMGRAPTKNHSIDRIDNNGNYSKENCRWASMITQQRNKSSNRWIEHNGYRLILTDWAKLLNTSSTNIITQLRNGKPFDKVFEFYELKKLKNESNNNRA